MCHGKFENHPGRLPSSSCFTPPRPSKEKKSTQINIHADIDLKEKTDSQNSKGKGQKYCG